MVSKNKTSKIIKNPLSQTLGIVLQGIRHSLRLNVEEVAGKLGIATSTYRTIEAGSMPLHPGKILNIIQVFNKIEFDPLCKILIAIQTLENADTINNMEIIASLLSEIEPNLGKMLNRFKPIWPIIENKKPNVVNQEIRNHHINLELEKFLTTKPAYQNQQATFKNHLETLMENTQPLFFDLSLDFLEKLKGYIPHLTVEELSRWEKDNASKIKNIYSINGHHENFASEENLEFFDFNYFWKEQFEKMRIIYLDSTESEIAKRKFQTILKKYLSKNSIKYNYEIQQFKKAIPKIALRTGIEIKEKINQLLSNTSTEITTRNIWIYEMVNGNIIGFIDDYIDEETYRPERFACIGLPYSKSVQKLNELKNLWNEIEGD